MSYQSRFKPADPFYPMPNTGTVLDISAGEWILGNKGQSILNGGVAPFAGIGALPNMFKTTLAAGMGGCILRSFPDSVAHAHDTETTMGQTRVEGLFRASMDVNIQGFERPENLVTEGRLFFTTSVDYNGTEIFNHLKDFCKQRLKEDKRIPLEIQHPVTKKPYEYYNPVFEFWDSLSGLKTADALEKQSTADVGSKDTNMLAMNFNKGKSDIVEQAPDITAKHGIYLCFTAHVGQKYDLDPRKPGVRTLRWMKGDVKLKRVPENTTFNTGNFYVISNMRPLGEQGLDQFPKSSSEKDLKISDLIQLNVVNQRGKFGRSNVPLTIIVSQSDGWLPSMSNFMFLREEGKYGILGNDRSYSLALTPNVKMQRTTVRTVFRENFRVERAAQILMEMCHMFKYTPEKYEEFECTPEQLYEDIINLGYDWDLLLDTRYWFTVEGTKMSKVPFLSTMDLLKMRLGQYHPYWYPIAKKDLPAKKKVETNAKPSE